MNDLNLVFDKIYVITIPSFTDRIENMKKRLDGIEYEFFYGVYGRDLDVSEYRNRGSKLTRGQLSCALSHYKIYEKMVKEDLDNVLILEDDCAFNSNVIDIKKYYTQLPNNYSVFYLGYQENESFGNNYSKNLRKISNECVGHTHSMNVRKSCAELMLDFNKDMLWTADGAFNEICKVYPMEYYLATPKITYQDNSGGENSTLVNIDKTYGFGF